MSFNETALPKSISSSSSSLLFLDFIINFIHRSLHKMFFCLIALIPSHASGLGWLKRKKKKEELTVDACIQEKPSFLSEKHRLVKQKKKKQKEFVGMMTKLVFL